MRKHVFEQKWYPARMFNRLEKFEAKLFLGRNREEVKINICTKVWKNTRRQNKNKLKNSNVNEENINLLNTHEFRNCLMIKNSNLIHSINNLEINKYIIKDFIEKRMNFVLKRFRFFFVKLVWNFWKLKLDGRLDQKVNS